MSISFQDIRLKAQQKLDYNAQVEICANVVSDYCQKIYKSFYEAGRVSFLLSGYKTSERQWKNIQRFSKLM